MSDVEGPGTENSFYSDCYNSLLFGGGATGFLNSLVHRDMERGLKHRAFERVLELGAGRGEHFPFVRHRFSEYTLLDLRNVESLEPVRTDPRTFRVVGDAHKLPFPDSHFDRVLHMCLLHHVTDPEQVLREIRRTAKPGALATLFLSCDPGILVRAVRALTTVRRAKKLGVQDYRLLVAREHRNHVGALMTMATHVFAKDDVRITYFPLRLHSWNLNGTVLLQVYKRTPSASG